MPLRRCLGWLIVVALLSAGCGAGKTLDTASINSQSKFKSRWVVKSNAGRTTKSIELQLSVQGESFRLRKKSEEVDPKAAVPRVRYELDAVSDGTNLWVFNFKQIPSHPPIPVYKHKLGPEELDAIAFWRLEPWQWKSEGAETVNGASCQKYLATEKLTKKIVKLHRVWVDESRQVLLKRELTSSYGGKPTGLLVSFDCQEMELNPTFSTDEFWYHPGSARVKDFKGRMNLFSEALY